ncbi:MAG: tRNA-dihydrouridine synthase [bacterium]|nr:tRNA-dihydrouridine synthase [bacterium]
MKFSWRELPTPFFVLAPMEDVTDTVFRQIVAKHGAPDVYITEFTNTDALCSKGEENALQRLRFSEKERPIIAQIWGIHPKEYYEAAQKIVKLGFDGIDINMGCPQRDVIKNGACAALIKNHALTKEILGATRDGAEGLPLSVKTRIGYSKVETEDWIGFLLEQHLDALTIHARTVREMSAVPAHWGEVKTTVLLRDKKQVGTVIVGNGDVADKKDGRGKAAKTGADGIMIGRGIFHNLFAFREDSDVWHNLPLLEKLTILKQHVTLYKSTWGARKNFPVLKKFFKIYINGFENASAIRMQFMATSTPDEAIALADQLLA